MSEPSSRLQERLLYLASPIGLLAVWEILLALGFGDRRFVPAPSDIAVRFWELAISGELAADTAVTLWRVLAGFVLLLLAFGFGDASKIALVATAVFFPVIVNTYAGAANIDRIYWDVAKNFGASTYVMFTRGR
jgi:ABC-type nitrate/sulfonate/bicarbonate transport system permease component